MKRVRTRLSVLLSLLLVLALLTACTGGGDPQPSGSGDPVNTDSPLPSGTDSPVYTEPVEPSPSVDPVPSHEPTPAENAYNDLAGSWILVCGETEGDVWYADSIGVFSAYYFYSDGYADYSWFDMEIDENDCEYEALPLVWSQEVLYDGCENESWIVQILSPEPGIELYATITDPSTLRVLQFFEDPESDYFVSCLMTYRRDHTDEDTLDELRQDAAQDDAVVAAAFLHTVGGAYENGLHGLLEGTYTLSSYPFLTAIPSERTIDWDGQELYCVVPVDPACRVAVDAIDPLSGEVVRELYRSESGEPILLKCNSYESEFPNTRVSVTDPNGYTVTFSPSLAADTLATQGTDIYDFTSYDAREMVADEVYLADTTWCSGETYPVTFFLSFSDGSDGQRIEFARSPSGEPINERYTGIFYHADSVGNPTRADHEDYLFELERTEGSGEESIRGRFRITRFPDPGDVIIVTHVDGDPLLEDLEKYPLYFKRSFG